MTKDCPCCHPGGPSALTPICLTCRARVYVGRPILYRSERWVIVDIVPIPGNTTIGPPTIESPAGDRESMNYLFAAQLAMEWDAYAAMMPGDYVDDKNRLDWLDAMGVIADGAEGDPWICRTSSTFRGMRLQQSQLGTHSTPRAAIDAMMTAFDTLIKAGVAR